MAFPQTKVFPVKCIVQTKEICATSFSELIARKVLLLYYL
jgi:hypothetical protein